MTKKKKTKGARASKKTANPKKPKHKGPWVLIFDIETAPIMGHVWSIWQQNVGLNQIRKDWHLLSWSAKWLHSDEIMYRSQRDCDDVEDDRKILEALWKLLDKADIVITHNGRSFDQKKVQARFLAHGMKPPSSYEHIDTKLLAKKHFNFTSNKLEYLATHLKVKHQKLKHNKFPGHELWVECLAGNPDAWDEMEKYNKQDVRALQEVYEKLIPWDDKLNFSVYDDSIEGHVCKCGSTSLHKRGFRYTQTGKFQKYRCTECGAETRDRINLMAPEKRKWTHVGTPR